MAERLEFLLLLAGCFSIDSNSVPMKFNQTALSKRHQTNLLTDQPQGIASPSNWQNFMLLSDNRGDLTNVLAAG